MRGVGTRRAENDFLRRQQTITNHLLKKVTI